ncbi:hypothetical protein T05_13203 [Trichinella murrelli]|uniref:Uncharacterized protein n=1 Tax=Trichinella murrelli TaxID=144512 RepID=A0A0V0T0E6_9BILA|nr:hypothetical protein T05_13203 [Trichinella murrelli]
MAPLICRRRTCIKCILQIRMNPGNPKILDRAVAQSHRK